MVGAITDATVGARVGAIVGTITGASVGRMIVGRVGALVGVAMGAHAIKPIKIIATSNARWFRISTSAKITTNFYPFDPFSNSLSYSPRVK
jgi:uncharacterized protein YcfJ